jgi:methylenetetrahydrofolate dehydrogenase (NADP+)/methenyltetrahydrofolate cyclohydrolase
MESTIGELVVEADRLGDHSTRRRMSSTRLLPGGPVAESVLNDVAARAAVLTEKSVTPSLATILVGDDDASAGYIRIKQRQAAELGFDSPHTHLPADATQADLHAAIAAYNDDPAVHGLLVQYPVPGHLDYDAALQAMDPDKDVDGMHPLNMGRLALGMPGPLPCTPAGIEALLAYYDIPVSGREVVILGRGDEDVGSPSDASGRLIDKAISTSRSATSADAPSMPRPHLARAQEHRESKVLCEPAVGGVP